MDENEFSYMNVLPLVDVMLVLLAIVLMTSSMIATGAIPLQLPQVTKNKDTMIKLKTIEIDQNGSIYFENSIVDRNKLYKVLGQIDRSSPILIRADKGLVLQKFVDVLDVVKSRNFAQINLQTELAR